MRAPKALPPGVNGVIASSDFAPARQWSPLELDILGTPDSGPELGGRLTFSLGSSLDFRSLLLTYFFTALVFLAHDVAERHHLQGRTAGVRAQSQGSLFHLLHTYLQSGLRAGCAHVGANKPQAAKCADSGQAGAESRSTMQEYGLLAASERWHGIQCKSAVVWFVLER